MNSYHSVFSTQDPQNNRNQFELPQQTTNAVPVKSVDIDLLLKFLEVVSKDPVNEHLSSEQKLEIAKKLVESL